MRSFFLVADFNARGDLLMKERYTYDALLQIPLTLPIVAQASGAFYRAPEEFTLQLDGSKLHVRWCAVSSSTGIATIRLGRDLASLSMIVCGRDPEADKITLGAFQRHLLHELHDTGYEPGFGLSELTERPLVATINFFSPEHEDEKMRLALADRCLAAAYFRSQGIA